MEAGAKVHKIVGIVLYNDVELLDFSGPVEAFTLSENKNYFANSPFQVITIAQTTQTILTRGGIKVMPDFSFETCPKVDLLIIPGGRGTRREMYNPSLIGWLNRVKDDIPIIASVCSGALILARLDDMDGKLLATHKNVRETLEKSFPNVKVSKERCAQDGKYYSSAGISAGIDLALRIIADVIDLETAKQVSDAMEYDWKECLPE
ncbi:MAG: DJ-1/PfpI family protein [Candidatus Heimdallarchaeota archaeon]|nr:DJ-1/PfpI family protein [Candidatus Heimdallarchaeota archaeon]MCK5048755.1 DJ-1/PfpI family protein [Candidatus Heimdallarchaeota archaeon]